MYLFLCTSLYIFNFGFLVLAVAFIVIALEYYDLYKNKKINNSLIYNKLNPILLLILKNN